MMLEYQVSGISDEQFELHKQCRPGGHTAVSARTALL